MALHSLTVNGRRVSVEADPAMPLLWVLRDTLGLTGTKYGCGAGACGACTVLVNGTALRACQLPVGEVTQPVTTIEGLAGADRHPVQQAWLEEDVAQCGYCQPAAILTTVALLRLHPHPSDVQVNEAFAGFVCRCGSYARMRRAVHRAAGDSKP